MLLAVPVDGQDVFSTLLQYGLPGVFIILMLTGVLVTKNQFDQMKQDRDSWRTAYDKEVDAHTATRAALSEAVKAAGSSLETAKTTTALLTQLGHVAEIRKSGS